MPFPQYTFELRIEFTPKNPSTMKHLKDRVLTWLPAHGVDEFVEGIVDGLDIDHEYTGPNERDFYHELGGERLPVSVFKYSRELLEDLMALLKKDFSEELLVSIQSMETSTWLEGWKESFKPIETKKFYIYPPWDSAKIPSNKIPIIVEPGMAFGTGQHATTQAVLRKLEDFILKGMPVHEWRFTDVGTGTGILALAAAKAGFKSVSASDIDPDAVIAARNNIQLNQESFEIWQGSSPIHGVHGQASFTPPFELVVANILFVVLRKIIHELALITKPNGHLILSGVLVTDALEMTALAKEQGLELIDQSELEGWACLTFIKRITKEVS